MASKHFGVSLPSTHFLANLPTSVGLHGVLHWSGDEREITVYSDNAMVVKIHGIFEPNIRRVRDREWRSWYSWSSMASRSEVLSSSWLSFAIGNRPRVDRLNVNIS